MIKTVEAVNELVLQAAREARAENKGDIEPAFTGRVPWPVTCTVGPGLEGAIACESKVGYVNGSQGALIYRGYDVFDLCAYSTFEEVSYLLLHGRLPTPHQLTTFRRKLARYRVMPKTLRLLMSFPVETMSTMAGLRIGVNMMRQEFTLIDQEGSRRDPRAGIGTDEDSIPMETMPIGGDQAVYEFHRPSARRSQGDDGGVATEGSSFDSCCHLIAGVSSISTAIARLREGKMPVEPDPDLGHAANFLYMLTGQRPSPVEERIMDIALILHADHGMNASTFAAVVVASTLSDVYASIGAGIAALTGPLHGGANEEVLKLLRRIGSADRVKDWYRAARQRKQKVMGFGHRVYKTYDPRARVLGNIARHITGRDRGLAAVFKTALALEKEVVSTVGDAKGIYPNVDFYSGLVYRVLGVPEDMFTPTFAVSRVSGWTARVMEYLENNRIFRPRAIYTGPLNLPFVPLHERKGRHSSKS